MSSIGSTIRRLRRASGLSLQQLADRCGLSAPQLSKLENERVDPSVATLRKVAQSLGVSMALLVSSEETQKQIDPVRKDGGFLFRRFTDGGNVVLEEFLHIRRDSRMQPEIMTFPPGSTSGQPLTHEGEEFFYVLAGRITFVYGEDRYSVDEGGSLYFDSSRPHRWENPDTSNEARLLVVSCPPTF